jgi:type I restriction enzyme M protein
MPDFNDATKLGSGKEMVDRLTNLIAIFENPALDFSKNRADGDDILGDAYEYLMRHFATESGKSKGQFYTPAEVSRVIAEVLGIRTANTTNDTTVYDPTCGSGSLLLKVGDAASARVTLYGQEKDSTTAGLARMNMILHNNPTALIMQGNTLTDPKFRDGESLKTFDYVVANPPFSDKRWSTGLDPLNDPFQRFQPFSTPPSRQGDYAYLLHIVRSLRSTGKGACVLPHGVLFRGGAEADIRRALVRRGYIKGIIGLPANLFYGTGIPACIVVIEKQDAQTRKGIFMVDASDGFMKEGPKNRLREQDIHKVVDVFTRQLEVPRYARMVSFDEIEKNDFNLNLPRYIDSQTPEDLQDIDGHLRGGIPAADVDALATYWAVCPGLRQTLFRPCRPGYFALAEDKLVIKTTIYTHPEFATFKTGMNSHFAIWCQRSAASLKTLKVGCHPREVITALSEDLLGHYLGEPLIDPYAIYQHLLDYWAKVMQDDCYLIAADGWKAETHRVIEKSKQGKERDKGWACDLIPKPLIVARYYAKEEEAIQHLTADLESVTARLTELEEEHGGEEGAFADFDKVNRGTVAARLKEIRGDKEAKAEAAVLNEWLKLNTTEADFKRRIKDAEAALDAKAYAQYPRLTEAEIKALVVDDKWLAALDAAIHGEMDRVSQQLAQRVKELAERYEAPLPQMVARVAELEASVIGHIERMGFSLLSGRKRLPGFDGKAGYKQTEAGVIPEDWSTMTLEAAVQKDGLVRGPFGGTLKKDSFVDRGYKVYEQRNAIYGTVEIGEYFINSSKFRDLERFRVKQGDFIVSCSGTIGCIYQIPSDAPDGIINQALLKITLNSERLDDRFFLAIFRSESFQQRIKENSHGGAMQNLVGMDTFRKTQFQLPPTKAEQEAIAEALSDVDAEIAALETKLSKARSLKQGMMQQLLTGKIRLL